MNTEEQLRDRTDWIKLFTGHLGISDADTQTWKMTLSLAEHINIQASANDCGGFMWLCLADT